MLTVKKYNNRKLYNTETSKYTTVQELAKMPLGSFKVLQADTNKDVTIETLLGSLSNGEVQTETKINVMKHCIKQLTIESV
jgi:polyhydroxyalkanoate synthesis regulator protein